MGEFPQQINVLLDQVFLYGPFWVYAAIVAACFVENLFPPFPGDSFIVAAGGLVALGRLDLVMSMLLIVISGMSSVMLLYFMGRRFGRSYFVRKNFKYFSTADIARMEERFSKWGAVILIGSRFVVGMRSVLAVVAGISRYSAWRMALFSSLSYLIFCSLLFFAAFKLVENIETIEYYVRTYNQIAAILVTVVVGLWIVRMVRARRKESS